jgi:Zn-finger nucleic acid-binding protein
MRCPVDGETLVMADRNGVEIDYCPKCRGVWLDRGELDKIIERAAGAEPVVALREPRQAAPQPAPQSYGEPSGRPRRDHDDDDDYDRRPKKRRESFLSDIFDF